MCNAQSTSSEPYRKRRRTTVVCTECRRRKIACDRNTPCTQCVQSKSACTFYKSYNSYSTGINVPTTREGPIMPPSALPSSTGQTLYSNRPTPQLPPLTVTDYASTSFHGVSDSSTLPLTISPSRDLSSQNWVDTAALDITTYSEADNGRLPESSALNLSGINGPTGMADLMSNSMDSPHLGLSPAPNSASIAFHKSRMYGPSHWISLLGKVRREDPNPVGLMAAIIAWRLTLN
jgi:aspyridone synthetase trans-acting enoyl reductase